MTTILRGRIWKFGDNLSGDDGIIDFSRVPDLGSFDIPALKAMCFAAVEPGFPLEVRSGDIVVGGRNFAIQNHAHASVAIKASGVACVVVESCDSGFVRKSLNIGLPVLACPGVTRIVEPGDEIEVDLASGVVRNLRSSAMVQTRPFSPQMIAIWQAGGLVPYSRKRFEAMGLTKAEETRA